MSTLDKILKYWKLYAIVLAMITLGGWIYTRGATDNDLENRIFTTKEIKYKTESYMTTRPSAAQEMRQYILDSVAKEEVIKNAKDATRSRARRDSLYEEERKARKVTDSVNLLNADQMYQIKEQLKLLIPKDSL